MQWKTLWVVLAFVMFLLLPAVGFGQEAVTASSSAQDSVKWGFIAAAIAVGASSLGAGVAVALVGSAAMGALSEKPEMAGRALIFLGLAEGIAIYGLIVAIMILGKI